MLYIAPSKAAVLLNTIRHYHSATSLTNYNLQVRFLYKILDSLVENCCLCLQIDFDVAFFDDRSENLVVNTDSRSKV